MKMKQIFILLIFTGMISPSVSANTFGRLFTSPEERSYLDKIRKNYKFNQTIFKKTGQSSVIKKKPEKIVFNGIVRKKGGKKEIWINGKRTSLKKYSNKSANSNNGILIQQSNKASYILVQPGQTVDTSSGKIIEPYQLPNQSTRRKNHGIKIKK